jgi:hypothetical protein
MDLYDNLSQRTLLKCYYSIQIRLKLEKMAGSLHEDELEFLYAEVIGWKFPFSLVTLVTRVTRFTVVTCRQL